MEREPELFAFGMKMMSEVFPEDDIVPSSKKWLNKFSNPDYSSAEAILRCRDFIAKPDENELYIRLKQLIIFQRQRKISGKHR